MHTRLSWLARRLIHEFDFHAAREPRTLTAAAARYPARRHQLQRLYANQPGWGELVLTFADAVEVELIARTRAARVNSFELARAVLPISGALAAPPALHGDPRARRLRCRTRRLRCRDRAGRPSVTRPRSAQLN